MAKFVKINNDNKECLVVHFLKTSFNIFEKNELALQVEKALKRNHFPHTIFDLSNFEHIDSIGIGFFIATKNIFKENQKEMALVCSKKVEEIFQTVRMERFCRIYTSLDNAKECMYQLCI